MARVPAEYGLVDQRHGECLDQHRDDDEEEVEDTHVDAVPFGRDAIVASIT